jgi:flagella basal body P-ring formation protein FlgA
VTWFADLVVAAAVVAVPEPVASRVRDAIAAAWRVQPATVRLAWGPLGSTAQFADSAPFRLLGDGRGGRFVVALRALDRREIAVTLKAGRLDSVWVASRPLAAGSTIGAADLLRAVHLLYGPPLEREAEPPIGWEVRRHLAAGDPVVGAAVVQPIVIVPGDQIRIAWDLGPIRVIREAIAQTRARSGEPVWARDPIRGDRVRGIALGPGRARASGSASR